MTLSIEEVATTLYNRREKQNRAGEVAHITTIITPHIEQVTEQTKAGRNGLKFVSMPDGSTGHQFNITGLHPLDKKSRSLVDDALLEIGFVSFAEINKSDYSEGVTGFVVFWPE